MPRPRGYLAATVLGALSWVSLGACVLAGESDERVDAPAIPPGQEELLLEMLGKGANLPEGCKLTAGEIDHTVIEATYACPLGPVVIELAHPSERQPTDRESDQFAFTVLDGSPPENLIDAVGALIRSREDEFEWTWPAEEPAERGEDAGGAAP